jgi:regulator of protease activity HflC (stomatin/prohibitin superfamily)
VNVASLLQSIAALAWIVVVGLFVIAVVRAARNQPFRQAPVLILVAAFVAILLTTVSAGLVFVQPQQRGVVISAVAPQGFREQALEPGLRWIIPYLETTVFYPISRQSYTMSMSNLEGQQAGDDSIAARTADGQEVFIDASVFYEIDPNQVVQLHIAWQDRYTNDLVRPLTRGVIRDSVSQYGVEEVYSLKRAEMTGQIREQLSIKLQENGLTLVDFVLRNITFSPEYAASVEQKQIAEQLAQQAAFVVQQRKQEAEQARQVAQGQADAVVINAQGQAEARLIEAEAESEALNLLAAALQDNPDLLTYQYIVRLAPGIQVMLVPSDNPYLLPLPQLQPTTEPVTVQPTPAPILEPTPLPTP